MKINMAVEENDKRFALNALIELLQTEADSEHGLKKVQILKKMEKRYNIHMARGTLNSKLLALTDAGYTIDKAANGGLYLEQNGLTDGELRILIDTVLYSDMLSEKYSSDIIKKLTEMGSRSFREYVRTRSYTAGYINKKGSPSIFITVEDIQKAIHEKKQISCNCVSYNEYLKPETIYDEDIIVNPYELAFSGGRYYLVCAKENENELSVLRVDRLVNVEILKSRSYEIDKLLNIKKNGSLQKYIDSQPELKGGTTEVFTLLCYGDAINDVYDAFGSRIRLREPIDENYNDPDTVTISVETTREAIRSWAIMHADKVVIISPQEVRDEIVSDLDKAKHVYFKSGKPSRIRMFTARSIEEAVHEMRIGNKKLLRYSGHGQPKRKLEEINLGEIDALYEIEALSLWYCDISGSLFEKPLENIKSLRLNGCKFDLRLFDYLPCLSDILISRSDINTLDFLKKYSSIIKRIIINDCENIKDFSVLYEFDELLRFESDKAMFTESEEKKLREKFPECEIIIREPHPKYRR